VSPHAALATAGRVAAQLRRDRRTVVLILAVPPGLMALLKWVFDNDPGAFQRIAAPLAKLDLLLGYALAFAAVATVQASVTAAFAFGLLDVETAGPIWAVIALAIANAILGMALGLFLSAFATSEFQAVQFMPAFILPQLLVAGLFVPRERMPDALQTISDVMPFTYAYDALAKVSADDIGARLWVDVAVLIGCVVLALLLGATTLRRRTA
jgi:ABC-2 type transport system permease protein